MLSAVSMNSEPGCVCSVPPHPLVQFRSVALHPAPHGGVVDGKIPLRQYLFQVAVAERRTGR